MESLADLTFWEIFFIALKAIFAWVLATASSVLSLVLGVVFLIGIGAIVVMALKYLSKNLRKQ